MCSWSTSQSKIKPATENHQGNATSEYQCVWMFFRHLCFWCNFKSISRPPFPHALPLISTLTVCCIMKWIFQCRLTLFCHLDLLNMTPGHTLSPQAHEKCTSHLKATDSREEDSPPQTRLDFYWWRRRRRRRENHIWVWKAETNAFPFLFAQGAFCGDRNEMVWWWNIMIF